MLAVSITPYARTRSTVVPFIHISTVSRAFVVCITFLMSSRWGRVLSKGKGKGTGGKTFVGRWDNRVPVYFLCSDENDDRTWDSQISFFPVQFCTFGLHKQVFSFLGSKNISSKSDRIGISLSVEKHGRKCVHEHNDFPSLSENRVRRYVKSNKSACPNGQPSRRQPHRK